MKCKSLVEELKEEERKEKETQAKKAKEAVLHALSIHPLASESRDIRDAYLYGLVFAAIADDGKVDVAETVILFEIAKALSLPEGEVGEAISELQAKRPKDKMQLITECVNALTGNKAGLNLFWAQFIQVWSSHADSKDPRCLLEIIDERSGTGLPDSKVSAILGLVKGGDGVDKDLLALADWMGDDALKYFAVKKYGDVSERLLAERKRRDKAKAQRREANHKKANYDAFKKIMMKIASRYEHSASVPYDWNDSLKELDSIDAHAIDWVQECNLKISALKRASNSWGSAKVVRRRRIVWQLACMRYVYDSYVEPDAIDYLLKSARTLSDNTYEAKVEEFMEEHFPITWQ